MESRRIRSGPIGCSPGPTTSSSGRCSIPAARTRCASPMTGRGSASSRSASAPACRCRISAPMPQVTGIDVSAEMLAKARRRVERQQLKQVEALHRDGRREPRLRGQRVRCGAGALCRLGGARPGALCRRDAPRVHARRHDRHRQPLHERERRVRFMREAAGAARRQDRLPRRFPARRLPARRASSRCARSARAICSAIGGCCAASTTSRPDHNTSRSKPITVAPPAMAGSSAAAGASMCSA